MIREQVPFDDLYPGDWITVWYRSRLGRVRVTSGAFSEFAYADGLWWLKKTGRI